MANATVTKRTLKDGRTIEKITPAVQTPDKVFLTADQIYDADDITDEDYYVERWKGWVTIRQMTLQQEYDIRREASVGGEFDEALMDALVVTASLVNPVLSVERARELLQKNRKAMNDLLAEINRINKRTGEGLAALEAGFLEESDESLSLPTGGEDGPDGEGTPGDDDSPGVQ